MKLTLKILAVLLTLGAQLKAQESPMAVKTKLDKLSSLVGTWEGTGWYQQGPDKRYEIRQTENVESKLNGTLLLVEGRGFVNDSLAFNAMAFFSYNPYKKQYVIESHLMDGKATVATGFLEKTALLNGVSRSQIIRDKSDTLLTLMKTTGMNQANIRVMEISGLKHLK